MRIPPDARSTAAQLASPPSRRVQCSAGGQTSSSASLVPAAGVLEDGCIVEYSSRGNPVLGLIVGRDGKKNWFVNDSRWGFYMRRALT